MANEQFRKHLLMSLGGDWPEPCPLNVQHRETIKADGFRIESVYYDAEPGDAIPALLLIPDCATDDNPVPGICVWHQHAGQWHLGKGEPAGLSGNPMHHTGAALARATSYFVLTHCASKNAGTQLKS